MVPSVVGPIEFKGRCAVWKKDKKTCPQVQFMRSGFGVICVFWSLYALHQTCSNFSKKLRVVKFGKIFGQNHGGFVFDETLAKIPVHVAPRKLNRKKRLSRASDGWG